MMTMGWIVAAAVQAAAPAPCPVAPVGARTVTLTRDAPLPVASRRPPTPGSFAGTMRYTAARAGTYRVALADRAWVDVVRDGHAVASIAYGHGAPCTGTAKYVDFALDAGSYDISVSGSARPTIALAVTRR